VLELMLELVISMYVVLSSNTTTTQKCTPSRAADVRIGLCDLQSAAIATGILV